MHETFFEVLSANCPAVVERLPNAEYFVESSRFPAPEAAWRHTQDVALRPLSPADYVIVRRVPTGESNDKGPTWRIDWTSDPIRPADMAM